MDERTISAVLKATLLSSPSSSSSCTSLGNLRFPPLFLSSSLPFLLSSILTALLLAGGGASRSAAQPVNEDAEPTYVRRIAPFEVRDPEGTAFRFPFLGGLHVPRPQLVDIDSDDDLDLFLQERTGHVMFFENTGPSDSSGSAFTWRTDQYKGLDVGEWYRFADFDQDGDFDLLAEQPYSYIRYYRNTGTPTHPVFTPAVDTLRDVSGDAIFSDRQNIPNINDIDCDGRMDLFIGRLDGTITRYEETGKQGENGAPHFRLVTDRFEDIQIIGRYAQPGRSPTPPVPGRGNGRNPFGGGFGPTLHGANTMAFADVDEDGDQDLLWGDFFEPGLLLIENTGSCGAPVLTTEPRSFPPPDPLATSGYNAPTLGDLDGDGDLDLLVGVIGGAFDPSRTARENLYYFEQTAPGRYRLRTRRFLAGIDVGSESLPAFADLDADDDLDLLLTNKTATGNAQTAHLFVYKNEGTPTQPAYHLANQLTLDPAYNFAPAPADLDADGDLDLLIGTWNKGIAFYRNMGTPTEPAFAHDTTVSVPLPRGSHHTPALADLDGDEDYDLVVGETSGGLAFYRNTGTRQQPHFEPSAGLLPDTLDLGRRTMPTLADLDGDEDYDLIVGTQRKGLVALRNTGTPQQPTFARDTTLTLPTDLPALAAPAFADVDGDGDRDFFLGTQRGGLLFYENRGR